MKKGFTEWIKVILGLVGLLLIFSAYCLIYGTPWGKYAFSKEVTHYITSKYPDLIINKKKTTYDFKQMTYISTVITDQGTEFHINTNYDGLLQDDYYSSIWNTRITSALTSLVKTIDNEGSARFNIETISSNEMSRYKNELPEEVQSNSKIFIYFSKSFLNDNNEFEESYKIIEGIRLLGYGGNIVFFFQNVPKIFIDYHEVKNINNSQDIKRYIKV